MKCNLLFINSVEAGRKNLGWALENDKTSFEFGQKNHVTSGKLFRTSPQCKELSGLRTSTLISIANTMATRKRNQFLNLDSEDEGELSGYNSGAADEAEFSRFGKSNIKPRPSKRRKLPDSSSKSDDSELESDAGSIPASQQPQIADHPNSLPPTSSALAINDTPHEFSSAPDLSTESNATTNPLQVSSLAPGTVKSPARPRGVIYLSRIPPFMRPSTVRSLLSQHGSITRLFLTPEPPSSYLGRRARGGNKKKSYIDGWVEFASRRDARVCTEAINAQTIGRKAGFYGNDVWNARFLKGFSWTDLMAGARAEEREREERVKVGLGRELRERKAFLSAVEKGRRDVAKRERREKNMKGKGEDGMNLAKGVDSNTTGDETAFTSTPTALPPSKTPTAPPSSAANPNPNPISNSNSKPKPQPEMHFRQHALAPRSHASTSTSTFSRKRANGTGEGADNDAVNRILRQIF